MFTQLIAQMIKAVAVAAILSLITGGAANGGLSFMQALSKTIPGYAKGGVVPPGYPNDTYLARLTSGETIVPAGGELDFAKSVLKNYPDFRSLNINTSELADRLRSTRIEPVQTNVNVSGAFRVQGNDLVLAIHRQMRSNNRLH